MLILSMGTTNKTAIAVQIYWHAAIAVQLILFLSQGVGLASSLMMRTDGRESYSHSVSSFVSDNSVEECNN